MSFILNMTKQFDLIAKREKKIVSYYEFSYLNVQT